MSNVHRNISTAGFTLIELLIVIAIIGVLSSVVLASLGSTRERARDTARIAGVRQLKTALELYNTTNGVYPSPRWSNCSVTPDNQSANLGHLFSCSASGFAEYLPRFSMQSGTPPMEYARGTNGSTYAVRIYFEQALDGGSCKTGIGASGITPTVSVNWAGVPLCETVLTQ